MKPSETGRIIPSSGEEQYQGLLAWFLPFEHVVVAFSGGVDSTLVLKAAADAMGPDKVLAVTADSPSLPRHELLQTKQLAQMIGVEHLIVPTSELEDAAYVENKGDRCYYCKGSLYAEIITILQERFNQSDLEQGKDVLFPQRVIVDGANYDDLQDIRPGMTAAEEAGVRHPLVEMEIGKNSVRALSRLRGLPNWDKPEMACLASRISVGNTVTREKLSMVETAELALKNLGFGHYRVRYHELGSDSSAPHTLARIELAEDEFPKAGEKAVREELSRAVKDAGFSYVVIDVEGYRKGGVPRRIS